MVTAIVGVLAALAVPAYQKARSKARAAQCLGNVHQLGTALAAFVAEHHEYPLFLNPGGRAGQNPDHRATWSAAIFPAVTSDSFFEAGVWDCPSASKPAEWGLSEGYSDYRYNARGLGTFVPGDDLGLGSTEAASGKADPRSPIKESQVTAPSDMYALGDAFTGSSTVIQDGTSLIWRNKSAEGVGSTERSKRRHAGKANIAFADSHVEAVPLQTLFVDESDAALSRWNRDHQPHRDRLNR